MMMVMMMSVVIRIFSIGNTAAALVSVSKFFYKNRELVSLIISPVPKHPEGDGDVYALCVDVEARSLNKIEEGGKYRSCLFSNALAATAPATAPPNVANLPPPNTSLASAPPPAAPTSVAPISFLL